MRKNKRPMSQFLYDIGADGTHCLWMWNGSRWLVVRRFPY